MPDIAPPFAPGHPVLMTRADVDVAPALHFGAAGGGTLCRIDPTVVFAGLGSADLVLLELVLSGAKPCDVCADILRRKVR